MAVLVAPAAAAAEPILLLRGTHIEGAAMGADGVARPVDLDLPANAFMLERADLDRCNVDRAAAARCAGDLDACERRACGQAVAEPSWLERLGWGVIIPATVALVAAGVAGGIAIGFAMSR